jgi:hypothetical protein
MVCPSPFKGFVHHFDYRGKPPVLQAIRLFFPQKALALPWEKQGVEITAGL